MKKILLLVAAVLAGAVSSFAQTATVTPSVTTYDPAGGQITFTVNLSYPAEVGAVGFAAKPPTATWAHVSTGGSNVPGLKPAVGETTDPAVASSELGWTYPEEAGPPSASASFTFVLSYPAGLTGNQVFAFSGHTRLAGVRTDYSIASLTLTPKPVAPTIITHPSNESRASGANVSFTVVVGGFPLPTVKWQRSTDNGVTFADLSGDSTYGGVATATLSVTAVTSSMNGDKFRAVATNGTLPDAVSNAATLSVTFAPTIIAHPESQSIATGATLTLSVVATGNPSATYQWKKGTANLTNDTRISGATGPVLTISSIAAGDAGSYSVFVTNGLSAGLTSTAAVINVVAAGFGATHSLVGTGYVAGSTITITNTITYSGEISALGWRVSLPSGWSLASSAGSFNVAPTGTIGTLSWAWTATPASPVTFTYVVNVPTGTTGERTLPAIATVALPDASQILLLAKPDPLVVGQVLHHSADTSRDFSIDLNELLRVISLYNTRFTAPEGRVQTGCYKVQSGSIDGFATDPARAAPAAPGAADLASYHSADTNRDGAIDLNELLRVISLYNTRFTAPEGRIQTGFYKVQFGSIDGYATDPSRTP